MTDDPNTHEEVARLLREQGPVDAPPDLADAVMAEVRRSPRRAERRQAMVRRAGSWAAAAAALVTVGFGISRMDLGGSGTGSFAGSSAAGGGQEGGLSQDQLKAASGAAGSITARQTFELPKSDARSLLGSLFRPADARDGRIVLTLSPSQYRAYVKRLNGVHANSGDQGNSALDGRITVILRRSP
jgi:hypothetical protein